ncbi:RNA 2',3'-cyclic phosphodiesterase [Actinophytocola oryzae]|uniref:RNA 2',3'-cyclic phosphodiesterase n=1 Tax=Actinophytocola oryzae TaxID=502181 RepID=A0A4R7VBL2_9PSEU|nr:RNA 2',3'-cyclic phosphodiesterase [Actinophytocola oryzae]TDV46375.1 2'-5' RNA ligase [Actinophytocola oryzae]
MVRLFSAIELPGEVRDELADRLSAVRATAPELSWSPPERWHITLGFYGDREHADRRTTWFRERAAPLRGFRARLRAAGRFPGVLWIGVNVLDGEHATALREMAGALADQHVDQLAFVPHVTVARWRRGRPGNDVAARAAAALDGYRGRWWLTDEVVLYRSDPTPEGPTYTALDRVALSGAPGKQH